MPSFFSVFAQSNKSSHVSGTSRLYSSSTDLFIYIVSAFIAMGIALRMPFFLP